MVWLDPTGKQCVSVLCGRSGFTQDGKDNTTNSHCG